ncbi:MAG TPA: protein kinase [Polyangiaceae bacterium]|jgi:eukaryotic-like serine/threonine-protein kinase|nr:protein kinase [Polyangiaceae bacterium]
MSRYLLHRQIASGGMASVHLGRLRGMAGFRRVVAIKRLHPQYARDPVFVETLLDEARLVSRIRHPNVVPVLDLVKHRGETLVVMEYIHGLAASALIERCGRIPTHVALTIVGDVLRGLHAAHEADVVHRDVSPQNVLVSADGVALITDFGIAKARGRAQVTKTGQIKGKLAYMAPEQLAGGSLSPRTDVYAASIVAWELLAGRRLFDGASDAEVYARVVQHQIPALPDSHVEAIVRRGLSAEPAERFESARAMALALQSAAPAATRTEVAAWMESVAADALAERDAWLLEMERPMKKRRHGAWAVGAALSLVAAGLWLGSTPAPARIADALPVPSVSAPPPLASAPAIAPPSSATPPAPVVTPRRFEPRPQTRPCRRLGADGIWRIEQCPVRR